jgi:hypothetical protein
MPVDFGVFRVLRAYLRVLRLGVIQIGTIEIWKMRYEGQEERKVGRGQA